MAKKIIKIMLDPGHDKAKYNKGAHPDYYEGAQMWKLYQFLRKELEAYGFVVGATKTKCDQAITVTARGRMAKGYDLLISLHSNACDSASVDRPVGIYFVDDNCGKIDDISKEMAKLLSVTVEKTMKTQTAQQYSSKSTKDRDGDGKKNDDYYGVLYGAHQVGVPAIILENSFHTNRRAAEWLLKDSNLKTLAVELAKTLATYYGLKKSTSTTSTSTSNEGDDLELIKLTGPVLRRGVKGNQVKFLQSLLKGYGYYSDKVDGSYGPNTEVAVRKLQSTNNLEADGICGPKTLALLASGNVKIM